MRVYTTYERYVTPRVYPLLREFGKAVGLPEPFSTSDEFCQQWNGIMNLRMAFLVVADDGQNGFAGALGALVAPRMYWPGWLASETFFWIRPKYRGGLTAARMLKEFEAEARRRNCVVAHVGHKHRFRAEEMERFYSRFGYVPIESIYQKEL